LGGNRQQGFENGNRRIPGDNCMKLKALRSALAVGAIAVASGYAVPASALFTFTELDAFAGGVGAASPALSIDYTRPAPPCGPGAETPVGTPCAAADVPAPSSADPLFQRMSWLKGTSPQSDLILTNPAAKSPAPGAQAGWDTITTITQHNRIIPGPLSWSGQLILGRLQIFDGATRVVDSTASQTIDFEETNNFGFPGAPAVPNPALCSPPNPQGSQCDDFFTLNGPGLASFMFTAADGTQWLAEFRLANLVNATQIANKIYTAEDSTNSIDIQMRLTPKTTTTVAEPGTLTLLAIAVLGLGFAVRRRQRRDSARPQ